ncbi:MAG: hypothetical protein Q7T03_11125, partial [Deltaproteobacteria bacterium]|nr:hypothetical protein [Deltaproteobacteria bacterium]
AVGEKSASKEFSLKKINLDELITEIESRGFPIRKQDNLSKGVSRIFTNPSYVLRRSMQKLSGDESQPQSGQALKLRPNGWTQRDGVDVRELVVGGKEVAKVIRCKRGKTGVKVLVNRSGLVDTAGVMSSFGKKYIVSAPMNMTTANRKLTEIAFQDGVQMNWLLTPNGKDGLLIVGEDGNPKILDKREILIGDLLTEEDLKDREISDACSKWLYGSSGPCPASILKETIRPFKKFHDKLFFLQMLKAKKLSLLCGMLLMDNGKTSRVKNDGDQTSRRFFLEFDDGSFGMANSTADMSTGELVELLTAMGGVKRAIYMDTGMYDKASYRDGDGKDHILGHVDTDESTNRVVIFSR